MIEWLSQNLGTIIITILLLIVVIKIVMKLVSDFKNGKHSCGCGCSSCAQCHLCKGKA